jgi:hypothetical protein
MPVCYANDNAVTWKDLARDVIENPQTQTDDDGRFTVLLDVEGLAPVCERRCPNVGHDPWGDPFLISGLLCSGLTLGIPPNPNKYFYVDNLEDLLGETTEFDVPERGETTELGTIVLHLSALLSADSAGRRSIETGRSQYFGDYKCSSCHGEYGDGIPGMGPSLVDDDWTYGDGSQESIVERLEYGIFPLRTAALGRAIRQARIERGMSRSELASAIRKPASRVEMLETGGVYHQGGRTSHNSRHARHYGQRAHTRCPLSRGDAFREGW